MGGTIASAYVEIDSNIKALQKDIASIKQSVEGSAKHMETRFNTATKAIAAMGGAIATLGIARLGQEVIGAATKMDSFNRMLVNVEGSQEKANKRFEEFKKLAKEPVLDPMNLSKYYVGLKSVNVEAEKSIPFMKNLANAMAGVGAGNQQFALAMEQFVQMAGKGKVMGDDLRAIANSFPQIRKFLVDAFGTAIPEELEKKGLTAIKVMEGLNAEMAKSPRFAGGAQASQENFTQSLEMFEASLGKNVLPTLSKFLDKLTNLMDSFGKLPEGMQKVIGNAGMGGLGLLGIASVLTTINNLLGPVLGGLKGLGATKIAGQVVGSATTAGAGFSALGMSIPQLTVATLVVTGVAYWGAGKLGEIAGGKPAKYVPSDEYIAGKADQRLQSTVGLGKLSPANWNVSLSSQPPAPIDWSAPRAGEFTPAEQGGAFAGMTFDPRVTPRPTNDPYGYRFPSSEVYFEDKSIGGIPQPSTYNRIPNRANYMGYAGPSMGIGGQRTPGAGLGQLFGTPTISQTAEDIISIEDSIGRINEDWSKIADTDKKVIDAMSRDWSWLANDISGRITTTFEQIWDGQEISWSNFLSEMLKDWTKTLIEMEVRAKATSLISDIGGFSKGNVSGGQLGSSALAMGELGLGLGTAYGLYSGYQNIQAGRKWAKKDPLGYWTNKWENDPDFIQIKLWKKMGFESAYDVQQAGMLPKGGKGYASGGIAWTPQIAKVAEKEPELIIPLSKMSKVGAGKDLYIDKVYIMDSDIKDPNKLRRLMVSAWKQAQVNGEI